MPLFLTPRKVSSCGRLSTVAYLVFNYQLYCRNPIVPNENGLQLPPHNTNCFSSLCDISTNGNRKKLQSGITVSPSN